MMRELREAGDHRHLMLARQTPVCGQMFLKQCEMDASGRRTLLVTLSSTVLLKNSRSSGRSTSFCAVERSTAVVGLYCFGGAAAANAGRNSLRVPSIRDDNPESILVGRCDVLPSH